MSTDEIEDYLTRYAASLTAFDAATAASLWDTPGMVVNDEASGVLGSREAMTAALEQSYPLYRRLGLHSVGFDLLRHERMSEAISLVLVRWHFLDADGAELTDSLSYYILRQDDEEGLLACVCVETDAAEKFSALAAERGIVLPPPPA